MPNGVMRSDRPTEPLLLALGALAAVKLAAALPGGFVIDRAAPAGLPHTAIYLAHLLAFAAGAVYLSAGGRGDRRARHLAVCFLLVASAFADRLLVILTAHVPATLQGLGALVHFQVASFLPFAMWVFFAEFPRVPELGPPRRVPRIGRQVSLVVGCVLLAANALYPILAGRAPVPWLGALLRSLGRTAGGSLFWPVLFVLTAAALVYAGTQAARASRDERRRVRLLIAGLVAGAAPVLAVVVGVAVIPGARPAMLRPDVFPVFQALVYPPLLSIPFTTAYAVHVHRALDVKFYVRRAVQYALARSTMSALAVVPFASLVVILYLNRHQTVASVLTGGTGGILLAIGTVGVAGAASRTRLVSGIDRRFFRERYDSRQILSELLEGTRRVTDVLDLEELLTTEIDRALHLESLAFLTRDARSSALVSRTHGARPLPADSRLVSDLQHTGVPLPIDPESRDNVLHRLTEDERTWLAEGGYRMLIPLVGSGGELHGLLALGEKRSELPYTDEDLTLLTTLAHTAVVTLEHRIQALTTGDTYQGIPMAAECPGCGAVTAATRATCAECARDLVATNIPLMVGGKFRIARRIGAGGMGVVYLATDINLERVVAIKTLPRVGSLLAWRLRREARAMASVSHPNLALIYGAESWGDLPMLVFEYLGGGTLAERIRREPADVRATLELGAALAGGVDRIHRAGILHRDIKPSNIGFTDDGVPKLLDFGLARVLELTRAPFEDTIDRSGAPGVSGGSTSASFSGTESGVLVGTVAYLSPEAANGKAPDPTFDLWGLTLSLYEAIAGTNPLRGATTQETLYRIFTLQLPRLDQLSPGCPPHVAQFFADALASDRAQRPDSARALGRSLTELAASLPGFSSAQHLAL